MKRKTLRKNIVGVLCLLLASFTIEAKNLPDSVIMTVAGKPIPLSEFVFIAQKNDEADFSNKKSMDEYMELFKNFKLKVAEAEAQGMDKTPAFDQELTMYKAQLISSYLSDKDGEEAAAKVIYDRGNNVLDFNYILFKMPSGQALLNDTIAPYQAALAAQSRLKKGEDIMSLGKELHDADKENVLYEYVPVFLPMTASKALENALYAMPEGTLSAPIRTNRGYYLVKMNKRMPNPGKVRVAHILIGAPADTTDAVKAEALAKTKDIYKKLQNGEDFAKLAVEFSDDPGSASAGGELKPFGPGETVLPFEKAAFALATPGQLSDIVESRFGYHIIKFIERIPRPSFDAEKRGLIRIMSQGEYNFELFKTFDERLQKEYKYTFHPAAYKELEALTADCFPGNREFYEKAKDMDKTVFSLLNEEFKQDVVAYYMASQPFSTKTYGPDFMQEVYDLMIRELTTNAERDSLEMKHPEYPHLIQEYRDGILLFEISSKKVWNKPIEEQPAAEAKWIEELNKKYPVVINKKVLKQLMN